MRKNADPPWSGNLDSYLGLIIRKAVWEEAIKRYDQIRPPEVVYPYKPVPPLAGEVYRI